MATLVRPGYTLEIDREIIDVRLGPRHKLDPKWSFVDAAGHNHSSYDTLESVVTSTYWCHECNDEHDESEYRCRECGETIRPSYIMVGPTVERIPGLTNATLRFADGRVYWLRGDELEALHYTDGEIEPESLAAVTARAPDEWTFSLGDG